MDKRFEKRLAAAKNPRVRKHNRKPSFARKFKRPSSNVEAFLSDLEADGKNPDMRITGFDLNSSVGLPADAAFAA